jgi:hypothetical protein
LTALLLALGLASAFFAGLLALQQDPTLTRHIPVLTLVCLAVIAVFSISQFAVPGLLPLLMRDRSLVMSGQPWRLATSILVQDGGVAGTVFNLAGLLALGTVVELLVGRWRWAGIATVSVAAGQTAALVWQPLGAGNSILNFGLAGSLCVTCLISSLPRSITPAAVASGCFVVLVILRDIHGAAAVAGALCAAVTWLPRTMADRAESRPTA